MRTGTERNNFFFVSFADLGIVEAWDARRGTREGIGWIGSPHSPSLLATVIWGVGWANLVVEAGIRLRSRATARRMASQASQGWRDGAGGRRGPGSAVSTPLALALTRWESERCTPCSRHGSECRSEQHKTIIIQQIGAKPNRTQSQRQRRRARETKPFRRKVLVIARSIIAS